MPSVELSLRPDVCGSISVGSVAVIRLVAEHLGLSLTEATDYVSRCVFDGESQLIPAPSQAAAERLAQALEALGSPLLPSARVRSGST